jgi:hypothetical protein
VAQQVPVVVGQLRQGKPLQRRDPPRPEDELDFGEWGGAGQLPGEVASVGAITLAHSMGQSTSSTTVYQPARTRWGSAVRRGFCCMSIPMPLLS